MARYWNARDPLGSRISFDEGETWLTVVGVVGDVRQFGLGREVLAQAYVPLPQTPFGLAGRILVRTAGVPEPMSRAMREAVRALDPHLPIKNVSTLEEQRSRHLATPRLTALLLTIFAAVALVVTLTGLAGLIGMSVSQRTREFLAAGLTACLVPARRATQVDPMPALRSE